MFYYNILDYKYIITNYDYFNKYYIYQYQMYTYRMHRVYIGYAYPIKKKQQKNSQGVNPGY